METELFANVFLIESPNHSNYNDDNGANGKNIYIHDESSLNSDDIWYLNINYQLIETETIDFGFS